MCKNILQQNAFWETTFTHSTNLESCFHVCEVLSDSVSVKASYLLVKRAHSSGLRARHSPYLCRASWKWPCFTRSLPSRFSRVKRASFLLAVGRHKELQHKRGNCKRRRKRSTMEPLCCSNSSEVGGELLLPSASLSAVTDRSFSRTLSGNAPHWLAD